MDATIQARADYRQDYPSGTASVAARFRVEIVDSEEATEDVTDFEIAPEGAVIEYQGDGDDLFQLIVPSTCSFVLYAETDAQRTKLENIAKAPIGRYGVRVLYNAGASTPNATRWVGTILTDRIVFEDTKPAGVRIIATDDLGYLKEVPFLDSDGDRFEGRETFVTLLAKVVQKLRAQWYWSHSVEVDGVDVYAPALQLWRDLFPQGYFSAGGDESLYSEAKVYHRAFYNDDPVVLSTYEVLEQVCLYFNLTAHIECSNQPRLTLMPTSLFHEHNESTPSTRDFHNYDSQGNYKSKGSILPPARNLSVTASNKPRVSGGAFEFLPSVRQVTRPVRYNQGVSMGSYYAFGDFGDIDTDYTGASVASLQGFALASGDTLRIASRSVFYWYPQTAAGIYEDETTNNAGHPENYNIGRVRLRLKFFYVTGGGQVYYLQRPAVVGAGVPIFNSWGDATTLPITYNNLAPNAAAAWSVNESFYDVVTDPFDVTAAQVLVFDTHIITPPVIGQAASCGFAFEFEYIMPDGTVGEYNNNGGPLIDDYGFPFFQINLFEVDGFEDEAGVDYTSTNDNGSVHDIDFPESFLHDQTSLTFLGQVAYRKADGTFANESTSFQNGNSLSAQRSHQLHARMVAEFLEGPRKKYTGTTFARADQGLDYLSMANAIKIDSEHYKPVVLRWATGTNQFDFEAISLGIGATAPTDDTGDVVFRAAVLPTNTGAAIGTSLAEGTAPTASVEFNKGAAAVATIDAKNRTGQSGDNIVLVGDDGVLDEIDATQKAGALLRTDGSGVYNWTNTGSIIASLSARVTAQYVNNHYYGNSTYGWNYHFWSGQSFSITGPYAYYLTQTTAHMGICTGETYRSVTVSGSVRNSSTSDNIRVALVQADRPNAQASAQLANASEIASTTVTVSSTQKHYNFSMTASAEVPQGKLLFLAFARTTGTTSTSRYLHFTATIKGVND